MIAVIASYILSFRLLEGPFWIIWESGRCWASLDEFLATMAVLYPVGPMDNGDIPSMDGTVTHEKVTVLVEHLPRPEQAITIRALVTIPAAIMQLLFTDRTIGQTQ